MYKCDNKAGFAQIVNSLYDIQDELLIVASIDDEIKIIAPIKEDIIAITPYTDDIETVSKNIQAVKDAYLNAQIAKKSAESANNAKEIVIVKANEVLEDSKQAHLSALFAGERAEYIETTTKPILENIEVIKLSPQNAQIAKDEAEIAVRAKEVSIEKASKALDAANSAKLSALYVSAKKEEIETLSLEVNERKVEIFGKIDEHNNFIALSKNEINAIKNLLLQKSLETRLARDEAVTSAVVATEKAKRVDEQKIFVENTVAVVKAEAERTKENRNSSKQFRDETLNSKNYVIDLKNQTLDYKDETETLRNDAVEIYNKLKDVGSVYQIHKEMYTMRTGTIFEVRGV